MSNKPHQAVVGEQFGNRASAYLTSATHAHGADLQTLAALVQGHPDARALDLGCGARHASYAIAPHVASVVAYDLSPEMLAVVAQAATDRGLRNIVTRQGVAERLPFADGEFDLVVSRFSAHHWSDFDAGLREARRVLKPGGRAVLVDTVSPGPALLDTHLQAIELLRDASHVRSRSRAEWEFALASTGFVPGTVRPFRVTIQFSSWIQRMNTPVLRADAIRAVQAAMPESVARHIALEPDGSFQLDAALFEAAAPA
jgi:ubiquinone/menaquinone biosynthesis C-methylase UbiE